VIKRNAGHDYSLRSLQSILGVSRRVLSGLIEAGFVQPTRGKRNELRFTFQDVVLLRTAFQLQSSKIPSRKILRALGKLKAELPDELPLSGIRNGTQPRDNISLISRSHLSKATSRFSTQRRELCVAGLSRLTRGWRLQNN
jgi:DNA-binding transcriptional MerR regulator